MSSVKASPFDMVYSELTMVSVIDHKTRTAIMWMNRTEVFFFAPLSNAPSASKMTRLEKLVPVLPSRVTTLAIGSTIYLLTQCFPPKVD